MGLEVCGIFHGITKAFDSVWHDRLIFKLRQNSICSEMINILENLLSNRKQRVVLNGLSLSRVDICAGVPKDDDTPFFSVVRNDDISANDLNLLQQIIL